MLATHPILSLLALLASTGMVQAIGLACQKQDASNPVDNSDCIFAGNSLIANHVNCDNNVIINDQSTLTWGSGSCTVGVTRYNGHGDLAVPAVLLGAWFRLQALGCTTGGFQTTKLSGFFRKGSSKRSIGPGAEGTHALRWSSRESPADTNALVKRADQCNPAGTDIGFASSVARIIRSPGFQIFALAAVSLARDTYNDFTTILWRGIISDPAYDGQQEASVGGRQQPGVFMEANIHPAARARGINTWGAVIDQFGHAGNVYSAMLAITTDANEGLMRQTQYTIEANGQPMIQVEWSARRSLLEELQDLEQQGNDLNSESSDEGI